MRIVGFTKEKRKRQIHEVSHVTTWKKSCSSRYSSITISSSLAPSPYYYQRASKRGEERRKKRADSLLKSRKMRSNCLPLRNGGFRSFHPIPPIGGRRDEEQQLVNDLLHLIWVRKIFQNLILYCHSPPGGVARHRLRWQQSEKRSKRLWLTDREWK